MNFSDIEKARVTDLFGLHFNSVDSSGAVDLVVSAAAGMTGKIVITPNVDHIVMIRRDAHLRMIWQSSDFLFADGMPIVWVSRVARGRSLPARVTGSDLMPLVSHAASLVGLSVAIVGGMPGVAEQAKAKLEFSNPGLKVVAAICPEYGFEKCNVQTSAIISEINSVRPNILFFCTGSPKTEKWLYDNRGRLDFGVALSVGAAVDYVAGTVRRAPGFIRSAGLEWLWRLLQEPGRLWRRYLVQDMAFIPMAVSEVIKSYLPKG